MHKLSLFRRNVFIRGRFFFAGKETFMTRLGSAGHHLNENAIEIKRLTCIYVQSIRFGLAGMMIRGAHPVPNAKATASCGSKDWAWPGFFSCFSGLVFNSLFDWK
ncbi:hypothetical protein SINU_03075 [Sporolactobacillus inulinus CASD]|uniref:Uncharacterized protein n=1 Tax=Sporolactobacillus inulinus CASD TaxID=1069536 RepID=A0A0U1QRI5_9BACL|nr:hypothetical protein SINU_03075 [Sporolactobacillus inulinus CASD]